MPVEDHGLGGRAPLLEPGGMNPAQHQLYTSTVEHAVPWAKSSGFTAQLPDGRLVGPFNVSLFSPEIGAAFAKLQSVEGERTTLSATLRQVVILTVGALWKCDYERYAHRAVALKAGLSPQSVDALAERGEADGLAPDEELACEFTRQLATKHTIAQQTFERAEAAFGLQGIVDILFLAGCYFTVCSLLNSFEVPIPAADSGK